MKLWYDVMWFEWLWDFCYFSATLHVGWFAHRCTICSAANCIHKVDTTQDQEDGYIFYPMLPKNWKWFLVIDWHWLRQWRWLVTLVTSDSGSEAPLFPQRALRECLTLTYSAKGPWNKSLNFIFPTKYVRVIPKKFKSLPLAESAELLGPWLWITLAASTNGSKAASFSSDRAAGKLNLQKLLKILRFLILDWNHWIRKSILQSLVFCLQSLAGFGRHGRIGDWTTLEQDGNRFAVWQSDSPTWSSWEVLLGFDLRRSKAQ